MPAKSESSKNGSKLALQTAIITAIIGPIALLVVQHFLQPSVVEQTRESISTVTVSDDRIRELFRSLLLVTNPSGARATGFVLAPYSRYVVTASYEFSDVGEHANVIRLKGYSDEITESGQVRLIDKDALLALVDLGKKLDAQFALSTANSDVKIFDKIFDTGYARGDFPVLREGRVATLDYTVNGRRSISADLPWELGMVGSPVFDKNSKVIGVLVGGVPGSAVAVVAPITRVLQLLEGNGDER
jgi:hypothetical protein